MLEIVIKRLSFALVAVAIFASPSMADGKINSSWATYGFSNPESVFYDRAADLVYVSNVNGHPMEADGNGFISKLTPDGQVLARNWVSGLNAPKGMAMAGGVLYVSDINRLVAIDVSNGTILKSYDAPEAKFLNDVTADEKGRIYVSDFLADTVYRLDGGTFSPWVKDPSLKSPNGLLAEKNRLVVASWGRMVDGFKTDVPGHLLTISFEDARVASLGDGRPVGNLDGIVSAGDGVYFVSDWMSGGLFRVSTDGSFKKLLTLPSGSADIGYDDKRNHILIPMMKDNFIFAATYLEK